MLTAREPFDLRVALLAIDRRYRRSFVASTWGGLSSYLWKDCRSQVSVNWPTFQQAMKDVRYTFLDWVEGTCPWRSALDRLEAAVRARATLTRRAS